MKKYVTVVLILAVLAIGAFTGGFAVRATDLGKFPLGGIYAMRANSYYGITEQDSNLVISLEIFEVRKGLKVRLVDYKDIQLEDEEGNVYEAEAKSLTPTYADYALTKTTVRLGYSAGEDCPFREGVTKIVRAKLIGQEKDADQTIPVGNIVVERIIGQEEKYFSYSAYTQSSEQMTSYNINVRNVTENTVRINGIQFILDGMTADVTFLDDYGNFLCKDTCQLAAGKSVILSVTFTGDCSYEKVLNTKFRPLIKFRAGGEDIFASVSAVTDYISVLTRSQAASYLRRLAEND